MKWVSLFVVLYFKRYNHYSFTVSNTGFFNSIRAKQIIMSRISGFVIAVLVVLIAGVFVAGCTNSASVNTTPAQTSAITTTPGTTALYTAGDIVRSPKASAETGYLILKYDSGSDSYERAFIYRNTDGSWGYRVDSSTATLSRSALEKVYTVKITHIDPSQVSLKQPTVTTSTVTVAGTSTSTSTTTTPVTTISLAMKPQVKGITPDNGLAATSVAISDLQGNGFQSGASVILARVSSVNISATNVNVLSSSHISCTFTLPVNATIGTWDIIVVNPDGQSTRYNDVFRVRENTNPITTTTTSTTSGISISSIDDPKFAMSGAYLPITVHGSNFKDLITCKLTKSGNADILASTVSRSSDTQMQCFFTIPAGSYGSWNIVLTNTDGTNGTLTDGFSVIS
jgi:hypothetical protein